MKNQLHYRLNLNFLPGLFPILDTRPKFGFRHTLVYGLPLFIVSLVWGKEIISKALGHMCNALKYGLIYFGIFTVIGLSAGILIVIILTVFDPAAVNLLHKPTPVLQVSPEFAWLMTAFSFLAVGPSEEHLFRGFVFGGLMNIAKGKHRLLLALVSSLFFASVHLYYAVVYGVASLVEFADLITFGMAMASTYYVSGGNLLIPAIIHGGYDATGFIGVATSSNICAQLGVDDICRYTCCYFCFFHAERKKSERTGNKAVCSFFKVSFWPIL